MLTGEAFFAVSKDESRPFIISTDQLTTVVHGTSFNVKAFPHESEIRVAVTEGLVSVETIDQNNSNQTIPF